MLKVFKLSGSLKTETAHMKISQQRLGSFDLHVLLENKFKRVERFYCCSFSIKKKDTIVADCIAELKNNPPPVFKKKTEIYFEGKLILTLPPTA